MKAAIPLQTMFALNHAFFGGLVERRPFDVQLRCFSAVFFEGADANKVNELNHGGKILLPPSALDHLVRLNIQYPLMFRVTNPQVESQRVTHCGVLEFLAEEGRCYFPSWMMRQLLLNEGDMVRVEYASLPRASYAKFKPQTLDFLNISNPRAVLEVELRNYSCLTRGDTIAVLYNEQLLEFLVLEVKPGNAVAIIECDMNVEFDAPEGYVDPAPQKATTTTVKPPPPTSSTIVTPVDGFAAFSGSGHRLDGKSKSSAQISTGTTSENGCNLAPVAPDVAYVPGNLRFVRYDYRRRELMEKQQKEKPKQLRPFEGGGSTLRNSTKTANRN